MKNVKNIWTLLILLMMISSCRKDSDVTVWDSETKIEIDGFVTGDNGEVLSEVAVTIGSQSTMTDQFGYFKFEEAIGTNEKIYVKAAKGGYFPGSRVVFTKATDSKHIRIKLLPFVFKYAFDGSVDATVIVDERVKFIFPAQSVSDGNGIIYNGEVKAAVKYIDPTTIEGQSEMPGNLIGRTTVGVDQILESYAMVAVELRGTAGQELNIADGKEVLMELDIPVSLRSNAPSTIPLWHFDEVEGIWIEEGSAKKVGNKYEGSVSHFSFWNCDYPKELVYIKGKVFYRSKPIGVQVKLTNSLTSNSRIGYTNEEGIFDGGVPKGELLKLEVIDNCNNTLYETEIGPFNRNETLEDIFILGSKLIVTRDIDITVVDCNNNPLKGALLEIDGEFGFLKSNDNGRIIYNRGLCNQNSTTFRALDIENKIQSDDVSVLPTASYNIVLQVCSIPLQLDNYIQFKISNEEEFTFINYIKDLVEVEVKGVFYEAVIGDGTVAYGSIYHYANRSIGENIPLNEFQNIIELFSSEVEYRNASFDKNDYINYIKLATVDDEYTEGTFRLEGVDKYRDSVLVESGLTIKGSFKAQYND